MKKLPKKFVSATLIKADAIDISKGFKDGDYFRIVEESKTYYFTEPISLIKHAFKKSQLDLGTEWDLY